MENGQARKSWRRGVCVISVQEDSRERVVLISKTIRKIEAEK